MESVVTTIFLALGCRLIPEKYIGNPVKYISKYDKPMAMRPAVYNAAMLYSNKYTWIHGGEP